MIQKFHTIRKINSKKNKQWRRRGNSFFLLHIFVHFFPALKKLCFGRLYIKFFRFPPCFSLLSLSNDCMICNSNKLKKKIQIVYRLQSAKQILFPCKQNTVNMNINYERLCHYFFFLLNIESKKEGQNFFGIVAHTLHNSF